MGYRVLYTSGTGKQMVALLEIPEMNVSEVTAAWVLFP